jgi:hypothetical protein
MRNVRNRTSEKILIDTGEILRNDLDERQMKALKVYPNSARARLTVKRNAKPSAENRYKTISVTLLKQELKQDNILLEQANANEQK